MLPPTKTIPAVGSEFYGQSSVIEIRRRPLAPRYSVVSPVVCTIGTPA
jgi:hypothetical protein